VWPCSTLYIPPDDRSGWDTLQAQTLYLIAAALRGRSPASGGAVGAAAAAAAPPPRVTLIAESFGGCLALRLAAAAPQLVRSMVLLNPATCYNQSLGGLSALISSTNLISLFPHDLYNTAQACVRAA
jgi:pimeloyl-ACP methyl ester carboxylesterase